MTARTVTGNTILLTGSAQASQTVTFVKRYATISGVVITQSGSTTATTDASGDFSKALDCPADGSTAWTLVCPDGSEFDFNLTLGDGSDVAVTTLIGAAATDADAVVLLLDSYVLKSGSTMTGPLAFSGTTHGGIKLLSLTTAQRDALTPAVGMMIYNTTTGAVNAYQNGAWGALSGGSSAWGGITGTLADQTDLQSALDAKLDDTDLGISVQSYSAKTAAIAALTWAANTIILLTGTATASAQALAAHIVTFIQSASAADARTAIGAGTGNGDVTGPSSSVDNAIPRFDSTTGKILQSGTNPPTIEDAGDIRLIAGKSLYLGAGATARLYQSGVNTVIDAVGQKLLITAGNIEHGTTANTLDIGREGGREIKAVIGASYRLSSKYTLSSGTATTVIGDGTHDVAALCRVEYAISATGVKLTGVVDTLQPSGSSNLYDDGGTNTVVVAVSAAGALTIQRTAGSLTYTVALSILFF